MSILDEIVLRKQAEVDRLRRDAGRLQEAAREAPAARGFEQALRRADVALIAEFKRRSPSAGWIAEGARPEEVVATYERGGAAALSVLTDGEGFGGTLADLGAARGAVSLPVIRKDFIIDPLQIFEARAAEADAVLLIARILDDAQLTELRALAGELGMAALVEVHHARDLDRALAAGATLIGVNNRDLATFRTDLQNVIDLAPRVPSDCVLVAESGIRSSHDVDRLGECGVDAILVGESLMRAPDIAMAASQLARRARSERRPAA